MSVWSLRWHFTNKSVTGAPYLLKVTVCRTAGHYGEEYDDWSTENVTVDYVDQRTHRDRERHTERQTERQTDTLTVGGRVGLVFIGVWARRHLHTQQDPNAGNSHVHCPAAHMSPESYWTSALCKLLTRSTQPCILPESLHRVPASSTKNVCYSAVT